jgi:hypothetical protein
MLNYNVVFRNFETPGETPVYCKPVSALFLSLLRVHITFRNSYRNAGIVFLAENNCEIPNRSFIEMLQLCFRLQKDFSESLKWACENVCAISK